MIALKIRTRLSYEALESILAEYCQKSYRLALGGLDTTGKLPRKIMILGFEDQEDRNRIRHVFAVRGALPAAKPAMPAAKPASPAARPVMPAAKPTMPAAKPAPVKGAA